MRGEKITGTGRGQIMGALIQPLGLYCEHDGELVRSDGGPDAGFKRTPLVALGKRGQSGCWETREEATAIVQARQDAGWTRVFTTGGEKGLIWGVF